MAGEMRSIIRDKVNGLIKTEKAGHANVHRRQPGRQHHTNHYIAFACSFYVASGTFGTKYLKL